MIRLRRVPFTTATRFGRFGGGWHWALGVRTTKLCARTGTVLLDLLFFSVIFEWGAQNRRQQ